MTGALAISPAMQDYLEVILKLTENEGPVRVTDIAASLGIAKASVSQAMSTLASLKLIKQERYGPIELTLAGRREAARIQRRHQLLYRFLVEILGVDAGTAEKDACLIEHVVSPLTLARLAEYLEKETGNGCEELCDELYVMNYKETKQGKEAVAMETRESSNIRTLSELTKGARGRVIKITATGEIRRRLLDMGVVPGTEVAVTGVAPLGDPIELKIKGYNLSLRKKEAAAIFVEQLK
ncbi:DtxR family transcriptional regulator [Moorella sp. Hama-1]|uniref:metal-dependent transcriptional regulator n=1 Tax=Moorella sp. Hama-1 TaxID=2138101 RepID=UPI000D6567FC|nr:DtxR family transcriptional regulator [Moorella sp. Hama-1]BCV21694.1 DtxR family transcriptional regulator [Moorella sp. Hama-1]